MNQDSITVEEKSIKEMIVQRKELLFYSLYQSWIILHTADKLKEKPTVRLQNIFNDPQRWFSELLELSQIWNTTRSKYIWCFDDRTGDLSLKSARLLWNLCWDVVTMKAMNRVHLRAKTYLSYLWSSTWAPICTSVESNKRGKAVERVFF